MASLTFVSVDDDTPGQLVLSESNEDIDRRLDALTRIAADPMTRERNLTPRICSDYYWFRKRREVVDLVRANRERMAHAHHLVDLGCGYAFDIWAVLDALSVDGLEAECVDISRSNLELARARRDFHRVDNVSFTVHDVAKTLPWNDGAVDIVYASEIVEHIPDAESFVAECGRVLPSGGHAIITTPNEPNLFQLSYYSRKRRAEHERRGQEPVRYAEDGTPIYGHISLKTNRQWDKLFAKHGMRLVDFRRGSVWYGATPARESLPGLAIMFGLNGVLDALPRRLTRNVSDQLIALYEKR